MRIFRRHPIAGAIALMGAFILGVTLGYHSELPRSKGSVRLAIGSTRPAPWTQALLERASVARNGASAGRLVQELKDGTRVVFTLDPALQARALELLKMYEVPLGAIVAYDLDSGATLVLAGYARNASQLTAQELCLKPWSPAASVFKLVSASALLSAGVPGSATVCYHGGLKQLAIDQLQSYPRLDRRCETLRSGVAHSLNPVLAKLVDKHLSPKELTRWTERFAFNRPIAFDLPSAPSRADIPDERLEFARAAAGFWHTEISVLHGAVIASIAATDGILTWPHAIERVETRHGEHLELRRPAPRRVLTRAVARELNQMMVDTVLVGTASRAFASGRARHLLTRVRVGGKTGSLSRNRPFLDYSWFVGFAESKQRRAQHPRAQYRRVAFGVLLGNPPRWRIKASTAAAALLVELFDS